MNLNFAIIILIILLVVTILCYRDFMSPAILMLIPWILSFVLLRFSDFYYSENDESYLYIIGGIIVFHMVYYFSLRAKRHVNIYNLKEQKNISYELLSINGTLLGCVVIIETVALLIYEVKLLQGSDTILGFEYIHQATVTLFAMILFLYFKLPNKSRNRRYLIMQMVPFVVALLLKTNGRAAYFQVGLLMLFIYLSFHEYNNMLILKRFLQIATLFFVLFVYVAIRKKHIDQGSTGFILEQSTNWIIHYLSGSLVTFQKWFENCSNDFHFGQNTFRIFYAIANRFISSDIEVPSTFFPFMKIGPRIESIANVYTIYYTYIIDFGKVGGLFIQGILGWAYGHIYWRKERNQMGDVLLFSVMMYPLMMQVFADQYVALESGYMQIFLVYFIFHKCGLLYNKRNNARGKLELHYLKF